MKDLRALALELALIILAILALGLPLEWFFLEVLNVGVEIPAVATQLGILPAGPFTWGW